MLAIAGTALAISSCATGGRSPSGFLTNFSQLDAGYGTTDAVSAYVKPNADLQKYDHVLIDPVVTVIATPNIKPQVAAQLAAYLHTALQTQVAGKLDIATTPGPTTLRVRVALTDMLEQQQGTSPVTTVHASPRATLTGTLGTPALAAFISQVSFEGEVVDSVTGERLWALCDHRLGAKRQATAATPWATIRNGANHGVARLYQRIMTIKGR